jgi:hypothetical protein
MRRDDRDCQLARATEEGTRRAIKNQESLTCAAGVSGPATSCRPKPGHAGSKARAAALTPAKRKEIAQLAPAARWAKKDKKQ